MFLGIYNSRRLVKESRDKVGHFKRFSNIPIISPKADFLNSHPSTIRDIFAPPSRLPKRVGENSLQERFFG